VGEIQVNYLAVLSVGILSYLLGTVWFSRVFFAKQWRESLGKTENEISSQMKPGIFVLTFISWTITAYILGVIVHYSKASTFGYGMLAGFLCWFGFFACITLFMTLFAGRPIKLWLINSGYALTALTIGGGILAIWR
jgi:hypothetical protein